MKQYDLIRKCIDDHSRIDEAETDIVIIPNGGDLTDTEDVDVDNLEDICGDLDRIGEISGSVEVQVNTLESASSHDETELEPDLEPLSTEREIRFQEVKQLGQPCEQVRQTVQLAKELSQDLKEGWNTGDTVLPTVLPSSDLSTHQKSSRDKIEDTFGGMNPAQVFEYMFKPLIPLIINESNRYASEVHNNFQFNLTEENLKKFVGFLLFTGYHALPRARMYWEASADTQTNMVVNSITRNTLEEIKRYLHLADNNNLDPTDKLAKVRPMFDVLNQIIRQFGLFSPKLSIDEQMVPYTGRHSAKQTLRNKTVRFGFKNFVLTDHCGYPYYVLPYVGAKGIHGDKGKDLTSRVVYHLLSMSFPV